MTGAVVGLLLCCGWILARWVEADNRRMGWRALGYSEPPEWSTNSNWIDDALKRAREVQTEEDDPD